jgi:hypothetical protein
MKHISLLLLLYYFSLSAQKSAKEGGVTLLLLFWQKQSCTRWDQLALLQEEMIKGFSKMKKQEIAASLYEQIISFSPSSQCQKSSSIISAQLQDTTYRFFDQFSDWFLT